MHKKFVINTNGEHSGSKINIMGAHFVDELSNIQKVIFDNKLKKGFNTSNIELEFCFTNGELAEAFEAYRKKLPSVGEELADVAIYLYGIAEILGYDLNEEIINKVNKNRNRIYKDINGVNTRIN
jgi:NTP pyrophosphatase (non-canonical NTP hydrolase)